MKELIEIIIEDEELTRPEKQILVSKLTSASRNPDEYVTPNYFIHSEVIDNNDSENALWNIFEFKSSHINENGSVSGEFLLQKNN